MSGPTVTVSLLFADGGAFHHEEVSIPGGVVERYDRLVDCLREDPEVLKRVWIDPERLCAAQLVEDPE